MIYFIQDRKSLYIKIGFTAGFANDRMRALQTGNPTELALLHVLDGTQEDERLLHDRFSHLRRCGEWFDPGVELIAYLLGSFANPPAPEPVVEVVTPWPLKIYLAGKISKNDWRGKIVGNMAQSVDCWHGGFDPRLMPEWPTQENCILGIHSYVGPYFLSCDHGCWHGDDSHGVKAQFFDPDNQDENVNRRRLVLARCMSAIHDSDFVFAWVDSLDCYGTIVEIGYAKALGKHVVVAGQKYYRDMWLMYEMADDSFRYGFESPKDALSEAIERYRSH